MTTICVAIYNALDERDPLHWALWLSSPASGNIILQIEDDKGGVGYYVARPIYGKEPARSARLKELIRCGNTPSEYDNMVVELVQKHPVDNSSNTWNCQAWIMESLQMLHDTGIFTLSAEVKMTLEGKRQRWQ